ncbi:MAG: toll/interleukin-1 receptor domain-containing protein [Caulobacteraceae bacterium]
MSFVYLIHHADDREKAGKLVGQLRGAGLEVWWREDVESDTDAAEKLKAAGCAVTCWSKSSVDPLKGGAVLSQAREGFASGVLVNVLLDGVSAPAGLGDAPTLDLSRWRGGAESPLLADFEAAVRVRLTDRPEPPRKKNPLLARIASVVAVAPFLAGATAIFADVQSVSGPVCTAQPLRVSICRGLGIGGVPTAQEETRYNAARAEGCEGLRHFVTAEGDNPLVEDARRLLEGRRIVREETWTPREQQLEIFVTGSGSGATREAAIASGLPAVKEAAERACRPFASTDQYRLVSAGPSDWNCSQAGGAWTCRATSSATCKLEERHVEEKEICG